MRAIVPLCLLCSLFLPFHAVAEWTAQLPGNVPEHFFAVDKGKDLLYKMSGASIVQSYPSIHGQAEGDKQVQGDLKTPEGIYFVTRKITQQLDFMDYGPHAFALNYPNPVDRLRQKTGGGIWLHSKGRPIKGIQTRGCVAVGQEDITALVPELTPGTPVLIAQNLIGMPFEKAMPAADASKVAESQPAASDSAAAISFLKLWLERVNQKNDALFLLYDSEQWKAANRSPWTSFSKEKRAALAAIKGAVSAKSMCLLQGPGYWTAFLDMEYKHGAQRYAETAILYLIPAKSDTFRIIGEYSAGKKRAANIAE